MARSRSPSSGRQKPKETIDTPPIRFTCARSVRALLLSGLNAITASDFNVSKNHIGAEETYDTSVRRYKRMDGDERLEQHKG